MRRLGRRDEDTLAASFNAMRSEILVCERIECKTSMALQNPVAIGNCDGVEPESGLDVDLKEFTIARDDLAGFVYFRALARGTPQLGLALHGYDSG